MTIGEAIDWYLAQLQLGQRTLAQYRAALVRLLGRDTAVDASMLDGKHFRERVAELEQRASQHSVRQSDWQARRMFDALVAAGVIERSPARAATPVRARKSRVAAGRAPAGNRVVGVYPLADGRWVVKYWWNGQERATTRATKRRAESAAKALRSEMELASGKTVREGIQIFLDDRRRLVAESTHAQYAAVLRRFFAPALDTLIGDLDVSLGSTLYQRMIDVGYAVDTHRNSLAQAKTWAERMVELGHLAENPLARIKGRGRRSRGKQQMEVDELREWDAKAHEMAREGDVGAVAALLTLWGGQRCSEIVRARVGHVFERESPGDTIRIPRENTKSDSGERVLELSAPLCEYVWALCAGREREDWLFPSSRAKSGHRDRNWPRKQVQRIAKLAGVSQVSAHAMRGANARIAARRGRTAHDVADALGHSNTRTTEEAYAGPGAFERPRREQLEPLLGTPKTLSEVLKTINDLTPAERARLLETLNDDE